MTQRDVTALESQGRSSSTQTFSKLVQPEPAAQEALALAARIEERYPDWIRREEAQNALVNLAYYVEDERAMREQSIETLRDLHANWRRIIDEQDDDGGPLIENLLYWLIEDLGGIHEPA